MKTLLLACTLLGGCALMPQTVAVPTPVACVDPAQVPPRPALVSDKDMRSARATNGERWFAARSYQDLAGPYIAGLEAIAVACSRVR